MVNWLNSQCSDNVETEHKPSEHQHIAGGLLYITTKSEECDS